MQLKWASNRFTKEINHLLSPVLLCLPFIHPFTNYKPMLHPQLRAGGLVGYCSKCTTCLQCFDTVGWAAGRASSLWKKPGDGGGGHCLVRMEWCPAGWLLCLPLLIFPCTIKSRSSLLAPAHPGGPGKRAVKRLCVCVCACSKCTSKTWTGLWTWIWGNVGWEIRDNSRVNSCRTTCFIPGGHCKQHNIIIALVF